MLLWRGCDGTGWWCFFNLFISFLFVCLFCMHILSLYVSVPQIVWSRRTDTDDGIKSTPLSLRAAWDLLGRAGKTILHILICFTSSVCGGVVFEGAFSRRAARRRRTPCSDSLIPPINNHGEQQSSPALHPVCLSDWFKYFPTISYWMKEEVCATKSLSSETDNHVFIDAMPPVREGWWRVLVAFSPLLFSLPCCAARLRNQTLGAVQTRSRGFRQHWFMFVCVIPPRLGCVSGSVYGWHLALCPQLGPSCSGLLWLWCDVTGGSCFSTADSGSDTPADVLWPSAAPLSCSPGISHSDYTLKQQAADFILEVLKDNTIDNIYFELKTMATKEKIYNNVISIPICWQCV